MTRWASRTGGWGCWTWWHSVCCAGHRVSNAGASSCRGENIFDVVYCVSGVREARRGSILDADRALMVRADLRLDMQNSSQERRRNSAPEGWRNSAPPPPKPRGGHRRWRGERSKPVKARRPDVAHRDPTAWLGM